jgi:hypothetical protein
MNEDRLRGPIPAFELLSVGFAAGAMQILGRNRLEPELESMTVVNSWKTNVNGPIHQIILGIWGVTHSWFLESRDADDVRAVAGLYQLLQGRPGEEFSSACGRLVGVIERWGADVVQPRYTFPGRHKYYQVSPDESLAWVISESVKDHGNRVQSFADDVANKVRDLRRVAISQEEVSESWHQERIVA